MEKIKLTDKKEFEIFIPSECDLDKVTTVIIRDRVFKEQQTGKWKIEEFHGNWDDWDICTCPVCKVRIKNLYPRHYCPNCGTKMVECTDEHCN